MLVTDKDALARLTSSGNLANKLKSLSGNTRKNAMSLFIKPKEKIEKIEEVKIAFNPFAAKETPLAPQIFSKAVAEPTLEHIVDNHESQVKLGLAHDQSLDLLVRSVEMLSAKLDDVKADKLPAVIAAASKTVDSIRRERLEQTKSGKEKEIHYHFYTPEQRKLTDYSVIDVGAIEQPSGV